MTRTQTFPHLLAPGTIGPMTLTNRVVMPAMDMNLCDDGEIEQGDIDHFAARAAGGTGLIITGACAVAYPIGCASTKEPGLSEDRFVPGLRELADAVHAAGSKLCVQMTHHGKIARIDTVQGRPLLVPSAPGAPGDLSALADSTPDELQKMGAVTGGRHATYHEATKDDIDWLVRCFAAAAARVRDAGADAVEIHVAHGYVLGGFLSRADNRRTDEYGGSLENRARAAVEVIRAVAAEVGDSLAILVRVAGREFGEDGALTTEEAVAAAVLFEAAGADALHITGWGRNPFSNFTDGPLPDEVGAYTELAAEVKKAVRIPVIAVGRILPEVGEKAIAEGAADFVAMGRQLLADPELVNKLRAGSPQQIRPCINCYVCVQENFWDDTPLCAVNPALGSESLLPLVRADARKHVVVVGAGPGGLEAARVAAERGHRVTVLDKSDRLGGTLWFSGLTTPDNQRLLKWLTVQVDRPDIDIRLNSEATVSSIRALNPDAVVVATGAVRGRPAVPGSELPHVHTGDTLRALLTGSGDVARVSAPLRVIATLGKLSGITKSPAAIRAVTRRYLPIGKNVVVIGGSLVGLELAEFLAERGRNVTLLEEGRQLGVPMAMPRRWTAVRHASAAGVRLHRGATMLRITESDVEFRIGDRVQTTPADMVVVASEVSARAPLAEALAGTVPEIHVVGDAAKVDYIQGAIHSAWDVATEL
ncbi:FAD-dependent oxidoreductase [Nocardia grenadensis]|uniref:oxidoreductase n=1 Tax=Nocardia grenadensis TaxID=931537 RepID=UPI003D940D83